MRLRWSAAILALVLVTSGCQSMGSSHSGISATTSASTAAKRAPGKYRDRYPADVQAALAHYDEQRAIDPCGLVDREQLSRYGKVAYIGGGWNADTCYIKYDVDSKGANGIKEIDIGRRSADLRTQPGERRYVYSCSYATDSQYTYPNGMHDRLYTEVNLTRAGSADEVSAACQLAQQLGSQAVSRTQSGPQRKDSRTVPIDNLAAMDPCEPIEALGDRPIVIGNWGMPFECVFQNRGNSQVRGITTIRLEYTPLIGAPQPKLIKPGLIKLGGVQVKVQEDEITCEYTAYVGNDNPGNGLDDNIPEQWVAVVDVNAPRVNGSCADARALIEKAISLYQQH